MRLGVGGQECRGTTYSHSQNRCGASTAWTKFFSLSKFFNNWPPIVARSWKAPVDFKRSPSFRLATCFEWVRARRWKRARDMCSYGLACRTRSEEHTSELQSRFDLVCRLL